jgi:hypothetical protein
MVEHHFEKSVPYDPRIGCPSGYHKRKAYTVKRTGTRVPSRCVRSTTVYSNSSAEFKRKSTRTQARRLRNKGVKATRKICPPGKILRKAYIRVFKDEIQKRGYTRRTRSGSTITIKPKRKAVTVPAACIDDKGRPGGLPAGVKGIGPLRPGELKKHGYSYKNSAEQRRRALVAAVQEFRPLGVYRKLDAVAKLMVRQRPEAARVFEEDRDWIRKAYGPLKAF